MSHLTQVQTQIKDLQAFERAVIAMGLQLLRNAECRYYAGNKVQKEYVIRLKGEYDAALDRIPQTEAYCLTADWFGGHVAKEIGRNGQALLSEYAYEVAKKKARLLGYSVRKEVKNGVVNIVVDVPKGVKKNAVVSNLR